MKSTRKQKAWSVSAFLYSSDNFIYLHLKTCTLNFLQINFKQWSSRTRSYQVSIHFPVFLFLDFWFFFLFILFYFFYFSFCRAQYLALFSRCPQQWQCACGLQHKIQYQHGQQHDPLHGQHGNQHHRSNQDSSQQPAGWKGWARLFLLPVRRNFPVPDEADQHHSFSC